MYIPAGSSQSSPRRQPHKTNMSFAKAPRWPASRPDATPGPGAYSPPWGPPPLLAKARKRCRPAPAAWLLSASRRAPSELAQAKLPPPVLLGSGGVAEVLLGKWGTLKAAVKTAKQPGWDHEILAEAAFLTRLGPHPNIVRVLGVAEGPRVHLYLEMLGPSLTKYAMKTQAEVADLAQGLLAALAHLENGLVGHTDVKEANLMFRNRDIVLIDFDAAIEVIDREQLVQRKPGNLANLFSAVWTQGSYNPLKEDVSAAGAVLHNVAGDMLPSQLLAFLADLSAPEAQRPFATAAAEQLQMTLACVGLVGQLNC
ncbi:Smok1 [Symbiodinium sp. CCMP2592]|nr:Smok1 [Symbiodinium sp. CCMP2592]